MPRAGDTAIRVEQRVTPLRDIGWILRDVMVRNPELLVTSWSRAERFYTDEGEPAVLAVLAGTERGAPISHAVAVVYAEDFYNTFDGRTPSADATQLRGLVMDIAKRHRLYLGERRRRFYFRPIDDWHLVPGLDLDVAMFPAEYPQRISVIQVWPAMPLRLEVGSAIDEIDRADRDAGLVLEPNQPLGPSAIRTSRLAGQEWRRRLAGAGGLVFSRHVVELRDDRYVYRLRFDCNAHDDVRRHGQLFKAVVGSVEPLPAATAVAAAEAELSFLWSVE